MKALSIQEPWVYAILKLGKDIENRSRPFWHTGPLLLHASKRFDHAGYEWLLAEGFRLPSISSFHLGFLRGKADMIGWCTKSDSRWFFGPVGLRLKNAIEFPEPIPWKGQLGLFDVPESALTSG